MCARADAQVAGKPRLSPLGLPVFPACLSPQMETQDGGGRGHPAPAYRCSTARPGEWQGDQRWSSLAKLACTGRAADFSLAGERLNILGLTEGEVSVRARAACGEARSSGPGPETEKPRVGGSGAGRAAPRAVSRLPGRFPGPWSDTPTPECVPPA